MSETFGIRVLKPYQRKAVVQLLQKIDVFVNLLTGCARSPIITVLFTNMRILKFKSQLTIACFAAVNHLNGPLRRQDLTLTGSKGHGL